MDGGFASGVIEGCLRWIVGGFLVGCLIVFFVTKAVVKTDKIESRTRLEPEIKLTTDGKTIDTLFIYRKHKGDD